ncbi:MAG: hypothetical protein JWN73_1854 [Betaproteobacteria bacterium]|nr:hypothetical protein [Betaproteobacteria bacterium]
MYPRLRIELLLRRTGWPMPAGLVLLGLGLAINFWWLPAQQVRVAHVQSESRRLLAQAANPKLPVQPPTLNALLAARLAAFDKTLSTSAQTPDLIKTVFAEAQKAGLTLSQAEYHLLEDKKGGFATYQMVLPVQGPYIKLREFIDGVLAEAPAAALEEVAFKRNGIGTAATEARLRLVFYVRSEAR